MPSHIRELSTTSSFMSGTDSTHGHPEWIGPWKLGKTLGRGATGRVLLASHQHTGQKAAVKVVSKSELQCEDEDYKNGKSDAGLPYGIEREIIIMKLLTHPNVLRLYDVWETSKALYLVLEYVEGGELFDLLVERGPLQEAEAIKYFRQIILGTAYCHALGICHRDLKPENLLLDDSLNVKLADFGMAALESHGKLLETSCGSPHYAAPEIVSGLRYHGAASDVWSCGVILFALLTGRLPFDDENIRNLLLKVQAGAFEIPDDEITPEAQDLIKRMLCVDPAARISTEKILSHPLLRKYQIPSEDLISEKSLPHPETATKSLGSVKNIDKQILSNLCILWNDRSEQDIVNGLLQSGPNPEKTFYALLLRYRHNHDANVASVPSKSPARKGSLNNNSPRKKKVGQIAASRPTSFQYKPAARTSTGGRMSATPSAANSPRRSKDFSYSPSRSPRRSNRFSAYESSVPKNIYNDIVAVQRSGNNLPPVPAKEINRQSVTDTPLVNSAKISPPKSKRSSVISVNKNRSSISKRRSVRASMASGLKRNSITMRLLSTYAKLSGDTDWEYMDKQTRRTSATFATLCDKIFNQEQYDEEDEKLEDQDEKEAREYERLMEIERQKHEAELKARRELEKKKKREKRRSLLSSKKLSILVKDDAPEVNNSDGDIAVGDIDQPKRGSKLRSISEAPKEKNDMLTAKDVDEIKKRSVTQPTGRSHPILKRRPVSRLDPLWLAYENEEVNRAKDALDAEMKSYKENGGSADGPEVIKDDKRMSMVSARTKDDEDDDKRLSRDSSYTNNMNYELPTPKMDRSDLSEEYMSEIRKSRLLNSQLNLNQLSKQDKRVSAIKGKSNDKNQEHTLIGDVKIPKVTRKSRCFTNSNKRLSVLSMYSTKESYGDLNSILNGDENKTMPALRTSFADRLDRAGLPAEDGEEDVPLDEGSIIDLDDHLASKRSSYHGGSMKRYSTSSRRQSKSASQRPSSQLPDLPGEEDEDDTFVTKNDQVHSGDLDKKRASTRRSSKIDPKESDDDVFDQIKLPEGKGSARNSSVRNSSARDSSVRNSQRKSNGAHKSMLPSAESMLIPNFESKEPMVNNPKVRKDRRSVSGGSDTIPPTPPSHDQDKQLKEPVTQNQNPPVPEKRSRSFFRKLSFGSKKTLENNQLPSPADSFNATDSQEERKSSGGFFSWFKTSSSKVMTSEIKRYNTILPRQEMITALYSLLSSWSNFGLKNLKNDAFGFNITGRISRNNAFNLKSCKFRIKVNPRGMNQKSEIVCCRVRGSRMTSDTLFKEIEKVLKKEGVLEV